MSGTATRANWAGKTPLISERAEGGEAGVADNAEVAEVEAAGALVVRRLKEEAALLRSTGWKGVARR